MIHQLGEVMLYVNDQEKAKDFWTKEVGFIIRSEGKSGPMHWIEIAPTETAETSFILRNKQQVAEMEPSLNLGTPSLMFFTDNVESLYRNFKTKGIKVGEIVEVSNGKVFNFADKEDNYFAVMEKK